MQTIGMEHYFALSLDNGVTPAELSEIVTHLAFYCGWSNAFQAVEVLQVTFAARGIGADQLAEVSPELLPLNEGAEAKRAAQVQENFGETSPGVVENTTKSVSVRRSTRLTGVGAVWWVSLLWFRRRRLG
jgi:4-carboxymuconolactone decarboxylase